MPVVILLFYIIYEVLSNIVIFYTLEKKEKVSLFPDYVIMSLKLLEQL